MYHCVSAADSALLFDEDDQDILSSVDMATMPNQETLKKLFVGNKLQYFAERTLAVHQLADVSLTAEAIEIIEQLILNDYSDVLQEDTSSVDGKISLEQTKKLFDNVIDTVLKDYPKVKEQRDLLRKKAIYAETCVCVKDF